MTQPDSVDEAIYYMSHDIMRRLIATEIDIWRERRYRDTSVETCQGTFWPVGYSFVVRQPDSRTKTMDIENGQQKDCLRRAVVYNGAQSRCSFQ